VSKRFKSLNLSIGLQEKEKFENYGRLDEKGKLTKVKKEELEIEISKKRSNADLHEQRTNGKILERKHSKMEEIPTLKQLLMKDDYMILCNPKEAYNPIPKHSTMRDLLVIQYQGQLHKYHGTLFSLNDVLRVFTQIMKKVIQAIRELWNVRCVIHLDEIKYLGFLRNAN
jgi:hypothetical protein